VVGQHGNVVVTQVTASKIAMSGSRLFFNILQSGEVLEVFEAIGLQLADPIHVQVELRGLRWQP
jgi:hypothetical protein